MADMGRCGDRLQRAFAGFAPRLIFSNSGSPVGLPICSVDAVCVTGTAALSIGSHLFDLRFNHRTASFLRLQSTEGNCR